MIKSLKVFTAAAIIAFAGTGCKKKQIVDPPGKNEVHFNFENYFGNEEMVLNTGTYTTSQSEQITINTFNYWITNIKLIKSDGTEYTEPESYRLLRGDKHASMHFHVANVPAGTYTGIKFIIGVDVARNTGGAQTGALDPNVNGDMYWTWATGYIQAKLEGTSPQSTLQNNLVSYHIAGVQPGYETPREVTLTFTNNMVVGEKAGSIKIKTDVAKWFGPATPIKIADLPTVTTAGANAAKFADNYKNMFSITSVGNE